MSQIQYFTALDDKNPYTKQALAIINEQLAGKTPVENPIGLFTIGAPGAGKTPLLRKLAGRLQGDISKLPFALAAATQSQPLADSNLENKHDERDFDNTVFINTGIYREALAASYLQWQGLTNGSDFNNPNGTDEQKKTAIGYVGTNYKGLA